MTVRLRLAALVGVAVAGLGCAGAGLATSVLAHTATPGVVAVDVDPADSTDAMDLITIAYAFPAGTGEVGAATPLSATAARSAALSAARLATSGLRAAVPAVVNGPMAEAQPFQGVPGCNASNNNCGLPNCSQSNPSCTLLNCIASAACNPANPGMGNCQPAASGGVLGCGLGASGINDCFIGLGCGLGGFGLGGCGLLSFSGCGLNGLGLLGPGCTFTGSCPGIGCGFFGSCGIGCGFGLGSFGFSGGEGDDEDSNHHGCGSFSNFGFGNFHFHGFKNFHFSSSHSGHNSK